MLLAFALLTALPAACFAQAKDIRDVENAVGVIPDEGYSDQPYLVQAKNGEWVCVLTTGPGKESKQGQHVIASISADRGKTWSKPIDIEPSNPVDGLESSWVVPYVTSYGRIYAFYTFNGDGITGKNKGIDPKIKLAYNYCEMGWFCFKYSDDNGRTWSERHRLPMRKTAVDYLNLWNGEVQLFWSICKPITVNNSLLFTFTKMAFHPQSMNEGFLYRSDNINTEKDPSKLHWEMFPEGEHGIAETTLGIIQEEHNIVSLANGDLYCIFRTQEGFPADCYSRDGGRTWSRPQFARYADDRVIKNPQACPKLFRTSAGKYLLWHHNNSFRSYAGARNPVWVSGGVEKDGRILWSQPEILLYRTDPSPETVARGMSYPDFVEENGEFWVSETQKSIARIHAIDRNLLEGLWAQGQSRSVARKGLLHESGAVPRPSEILLDLPSLKDGGFAIDLWLDYPEMVPGEVILDNRDPTGAGLVLEVTPRRTLQLALHDGKARGDLEAAADKTLPTTHASYDLYQEKMLWSQKFNRLETDAGTLTAGKPQHVVLIADGLANILSSVVNGKLSDGGRYRFYGWNRIIDDMEKVSGSGKLKIAPRFNGQVKSLRIYNRYLTTSEAISNYHAGNGAR